MTKALKICLTGGIACGKTVISNAFKNLGVPVIDTDEISREVTAKNSPLLDKLAKAFGQSIITKEGLLDRRALRLIVFNDKSGENLNKLNSIMLKAIIDRLLEIYDKQTAPYVIFVIPLLFEHHLEHLCDRVLVIDVNEKTQLERLQTRDKIDLNTALGMLKSQVDRKTRRQKADDLIETDALSIEKRLHSVLKLHEKYLDLANRVNH